MMVVKHVTDGSLPRLLRIYMQNMGMDWTDEVVCELTGHPTVDIHHIDARGMGGPSTSSGTGHKDWVRDVDRIENLMAIHRVLHVGLGDKKKLKDFLKRKHRAYMEERGLVWAE